MARKPMTNLLGLAVLAYLQQRPMHAYELHRQLVDNDAARTFKLSYGALYSVVRQLESAGHIARTGTGRTGKLPEHTTYEVTDAGRVEAHRWLSRIIAEPQHEYPAFAAALSLIVVLPPDDVVPLLEARIERVAEERTTIAEQRRSTIDGGVPAVFLVEDEFRENQLAAEIAFIRELIGRVADPDSEWADAWRRHHDGPAAVTEEKRGPR